MTQLGRIIELSYLNYWSIEDAKHRLIGIYPGSYYCYCCRAWGQCPSSTVNTSRFGFLNVGGRESNNFLIAGIALSASAGSLAVLPEVGSYVTAIAGNVAVFVGPALLVVALKSLISGGHD